MPRTIVYGNDKRFQVECDWYQPQDTAYRLKDGRKTILSVDDGNRDVGKKELSMLCDLLNELAEQQLVIS